MPELQDIFRLYGKQYRATHRVSYDQAKTMSAITNCRTSKLGGHMDVCENCGNIQISYNSCRNRHCPKCQTLSKERWIENQKHNLLNIGYFHVVFTIPDDLRPLFYQNQSLLYGILFRAVAETLQTLANDKKFLGATIGFTSILHTWGQNLCYHPHIHCIVPGGGLTPLGQWKNSSTDFFLPVKVLSRLFRGKLLAYLKQAKLNFYGELCYLQDPAAFSQLLNTCYSKDWIVYCKPPFKNAACVVAYLGRYTHRVAISNNRILKLENDTVTFKWRDYKDHRKSKVMSLSVFEFIRRFLMHVLPSGFMKIRHYGLLSSRDKSKRLSTCKRLTATPIIPKAALSTKELIQKIFSNKFSPCPACGFQKFLCQPGLSPPNFA